jgi:hypothetical protein
VGSGWYKTELITARFPAGSEVRCFLKDFGTFDEPKGRMAERRERERFFYKHVLSRGELGVARYLAELWQPEEQRYWLLLEYVDAVPLSWCEIDLWYEAATWLGRLRALVRDRMPELIASDRFMDHGPRYFANVVGRALSASGSYTPAIFGAVEACVTTYLDQTEVLLTEPRTLVHGAFRPAQVLVEEPQGTRRICPTDWEIAAIGSPFYDLATLADGFGDAHLERFAQAYCEGAGLQEEALTTEHLRRVVDATRMHRTMKWIAGAPKRGLPEDKVGELVQSLERTAAEVRAV